MKDLQSEITSKLRQEGASLVGFADISDLPAGMRQSMNHAVSIAAALDASIINGISSGPTSRMILI